MHSHAPSGAVATLPDQSTVIRRTPSTVDIGEVAIADDHRSLLIARALGSCVVCIWDPDARVAGMLHFLMPDAPGGSVRPFTQPGAFADTGIPLLLEMAFRRGLRLGRTEASVVGGAEMPNLNPAPEDLGRSNALAARDRLRAHGLLIAREDTGGTQGRSVYLCARTGRLRVRLDAPPRWPVG